MKTVKSSDESGWLIKIISEIVKNETKEQKGGLLGMILGTLATSLLGNMLGGKGLVRGVSNEKRTRNK